jgi:hypothetical protein
MLKPEDVVWFFEAWLYSCLFDERSLEKLVRTPFYIAHDRRICEYEQLPRISADDSDFGYKIYGLVLLVYVSVS